MKYLFILLIATGTLSAQNISTVAGGVPSKGDGGLALDAQVLSVIGLTVDVDGNLFIGDMFSNTIRRVDAATKIISTVAGNGTPGSIGDDGPATSAQLLSPQAFCVDSKNNLYIIDGYKSVIRKVNLETNMITRFAGTGTAGYSGDGGPALKAKLNFVNFPGGLVADGDGNIFVGDGGNSVVRRIDAATGIITTIAGTGMPGYSGDHAPPLVAQFNSPSALAFDNNGNLLVCDYSGNRVRKIDFVNNMITTIAGLGDDGSFDEDIDAKAARILSPISLAVNSSGDIYLALANNACVRKIDAATGHIVTVVGKGLDSGENIPPTTVLLNSPTGVALAGTNAIYVSNYVNRVYLADFSANNLSTIAGNGKWAFSGDGGPAINAQMEPHSIAISKSHQLYITDYDNQRIRRVDTETGIITTVAGTGEAGLDGDGGPATEARIMPLNGDITVDAIGNFIFTENSHAVRKVDVTTGIIHTIAGNGTPGYGGDGGPATSAMLTSPTGLAADASGNLYIADTGNQRIRRVDGATGTITTYGGTGVFGFSGDGGQATSAQLSSPSNLALDAEGNLYVSDAFNNRIRKITHSTGVISTVAGTGKYYYSGDGPAADASLAPGAIATDSVGDLYVSELFAQNILKINFTTGLISTIAGTGETGYAGENSPALGAQFYNPMSIAIDKNNLYIADFNTHRVRKIDNLSVGQDKESDIVVYNGISPNGDNMNDLFFLKNIQTTSASKNTVSIINRWEDVVWRGNNYDNATVYFNGISSSGETLPNGVYYYRIEFASGKSPMLGFLMLQR